MLDVDEVNAVKSGEAILLDVRRDKEYQAQKSPYAKNIEVAELESNLKKLDKSKKIFCYCNSGGRSARARKLLEENGFDAVNIGGYKDLPGELQ